MLQGTEKIQELIKQASSLHIVNTLYFIAQVVLVLFIYQIAPGKDRLAIHDFLLNASFILAFVLVLKISMHFYMKMQGMIKDSEFELILACLNALSTVFILYALYILPGIENIVLLFESFLPVMLFVLVSPLTWNKSTFPYSGFYGFLEWSLLLVVLLWGGTTLLSLYEAGAYYALTSNGVLVASPFLVRFMRKRHVDKLFDRMHQEIYTDPLTGIQNRKCFYDYYDRLRDDSKQGLLDNHDLVVLFADIDFFKQYNDFYGHEQGDVCLISVAKSLSLIAEELDVEAFRYGGEEFILCGVVHRENQNAFLNSDIISKWIEGDWLFDMDHEKSPKNKVSLSGGLCFYGKDVIYKNNAAGVTKVADDYLYQAKNSGRAKLILAPQGEVDSKISEC